MIESPQEALNTLAAKQRGPVWPLIVFICTTLVIAAAVGIHLWYPWPMYACSNHEVRHGAFNVDDILELPDCKGWHEIEE